MKTETSIRNLYTPLQPSIAKSADNITYQEFLPAAGLQNFIYCYWHLKSTQALSEPFNYRVVADGCIDIFFELNNPQESFVMGFSKKFTEFPLGNSFNYFGIRFLPAAFPQLFKIDASEISDRFENLDLIVPGTSLFIRQKFYSVNNALDIKNQLDQHFLKIQTQSQLIADHRLFRAINLIIKNSGSITIEKDLDTGLSPRQLRRLFEFYIGDSAKTFSKIVRFQSLLNSRPTAQSIRQEKLFFDMGYFDQAHFIKDFKTFYGITPSQAFLK
ncbi:helix-turn-helix domain-containing protein [Dyadobacter sp. CY345]|uniref:AraC family transcriptional regulator n=1 Tax=Dyadobacter sp. CY345 TaxID=2909335 RepID=UPI001F31D387|nr:helix-turn-helix domain-containing protein [Dyadobacter sp. CY345]MCF2442841.1 helix-turn-helix domain-containing protein [Dyadobacter sp. CY345]